MEVQNSQVIDRSVSGVPHTGGTKTAPQPRSAAEMQSWVVAYLANLLEVDADEVDTTVPFDSYGLDSSAAVGLTGDLADWLGYDVDPTLLYDYPTIESLVQHLSSQLQ